MFRLELNEGGMSGFEKNCPNGVNEFEKPADAAEFASTHLGKVLHWMPGTGANEIVSLEISPSNHPVVRILEAGYNYETGAQENMRKFW